MADDPVQLDIREVSKTFGGTRALDDVSIAVARGTVHAFVGENGAGKSTLGRIVAGVLAPDSGVLILAGTPVAFASPRQALDRGVALVAQELALVPRLTVAENVFLGVEPSRAGLIDRRGLDAAYRRLAADAGFDLAATTRVADLPLAQQQQVEILRALARNAQLIVFDEPTAALSAEDAARFRIVVRSLATTGRTVLLISHFLPEVLDLADTVSILRDGRVVQTGPAATETEASLITGMLGRSLGRIFPAKVPAPPDAPIVLDVEGLEARGVRGVSLTVRAGEIVGLAGLIGAGRSELARAIYGAAPSSSTRLMVGGAGVGQRPQSALSAGVALIPESRKDEGLVLGRSVRENVSLSHLGAFSRFAVVRRRAESTAVRTALATVGAPDRPEAPAVTLSGGNQQKLLYARAFLGRPRLLIADEPTRGVDIGSKRDIYEHLVSLASSGCAILLVSSEIEELLGLAHRIIVMRAGTIAGELQGDLISEEAILNAAFGTGRAA
jgi:ABC-type sugar transport system ATPase subunit